MSVHGRIARTVARTVFYERMANLLDPSHSSDLSTSIGDAADTDCNLVQVVERVRAVVGPKTWEAFERLTAFEHKPKDVAKDLVMGLTAVYQAKYRVRDMLNREYAASLAAPAEEPT